jgi:hypothetical protein
MAKKKKRKKKGAGKNGKKKGAPTVSSNTLTKTPAAKPIDRSNAETKIGQDFVKKHDAQSNSPPPPPPPPPRPPIVSSKALTKTPAAKPVDRINAETKIGQQLDNKHDAQSNSPPPPPPLHPPTISSNTLTKTPSIDRTTGSSTGEMNIEQEQSDNKHGARGEQSNPMSNNNMNPPPPPPIFKTKTISMLDAEDISDMDETVETNEEDPTFENNGAPPPPPPLPLHLPTV